MISHFSTLICNLSENVGEIDQTQQNVTKDRPVLPLPIRGSGKTCAQLLPNEDTPCLNTMC